MDDHSAPDTAALEAVVQDYFRGMYEGDVERLRGIFSEKCWLFGETREGSVHLPLAGFLELIATEPVPKAAGEPFDMRLAALDRTGSVAMAKAEVCHQGSHYTDYLMLQQTADGWRIVSKAFFCPD